MSPLKLWTPSKVEAYEKLQALLAERRAVDEADAASAGGLQWKNVKNRDYLVHYFYDPTGKRRFESKGPRSPETEAFFERFMDQRALRRRNVERVDEQFQVQAAVAKSLKIGRAPAAVGEIFRALAATPLFERTMLAGSWAMAAYETQARAAVPAETLVAPGSRPDLDLFMEDEAAIDAFETMLRTVDATFRRQGYGAHRFDNGALAIDCFSRSDLARIAGDAYGDDAATEEAFLKAANAPAIPSHIVDRSGSIAPVRVLPLEKFRLLKTIRANRDELRGEEDRAFDALQAEAAKALMRVVCSSTGEPVPETEDDERQFERGPRF